MLSHCGTETKRKNSYLKSAGGYKGQYKPGLAWHRKRVPLKASPWLGF